jgi:hypothetical protein
VANVGFANISNKKQQEMDIDTINSVMSQIKSDQVDITDALTKALEKVDSIQSPSPNSRSGIIDSMRKQED